MRQMVRFRLIKLFSANPRVAERHLFSQNSGKTRLCVFASFSKMSEVEDYVFANLEALRDFGFDIAFVTTANRIQNADLERLARLCMCVMRRENTGYDFGSWKAGILHSGIDLKKYDQLLLTNDSYYGPLFPWQQALAVAKTDLYGITDSHGIAYHLMSYFVLYNKNILHSPEFLRAWQDVRMIPTILKTLVIYAYEVGMSQKFQQAGFSISAYCAEKELFERLPQHAHLFNQTIIVHRFWRELIELMHCPILKVDTFWRVFQGDTAWQTVLKETGYDTQLIERHQKRLHAPRENK